MYLIKTYLDKSAVHGIGVFAAEDVEQGTIVWDEVPGFDTVFSVKQVKALPDRARDFLDTYAYFDGQFFHLNADNGKFTNHDDNANTRMNDTGACYATRPIKKGEEITGDYNEFCEERPKGLFASEGKGNGNVFD